MSLINKNMQEMKLSIIITYCNIIPLMLFFILACPVSSSNVIGGNCLDGTGNYTANSTYHNNLNIVLANLTSQASHTDFGTHKAGEGSNTVHGLFNCRRGVSLEECHECVQEATKLLIKRCPTQMNAVVWFEDCLLRYANQSTLFSVNNRSYNNAIISDDQKYSNVTRLNEVIQGNQPDLIYETAYNESTRGYVVEQLSLSKTHSVSCRVQCTLDILGEECDTCLAQLFHDVVGCCGMVGYMSMRFLSPSCYFHYNVNSLDDTSSSPPQSPRRAVKGSGPPSLSKKTRLIIIVVVSISVVVLLLSCACLLHRHKKKHRKLPTPPELKEVSEELDELSAAQSVQYNFNDIKAATSNFSIENKLGQGGFGSVYKGKLCNGHDIAVKRLSTFSGQGFKEFRTEVLLDIKLKHKNVVRLLGFCIDKEEKLLIYEFLPNSSLDKFLFDDEKRALLDWQTRYKIIIGIARGLLYLHEDCPFTIVHRDLKCGNILLDEAMNPKLADFGMARLFDTGQIRASTRVIVGTYGYMAPEYAMHGHFSIKSDVYSFGMILLEILSGQRCTLNNQFDHQDSLLHRAWMCWTGNEPLSLIDNSLRGNFCIEEVTKCIQIGLLCVQEEVAKRPTMSRILNVITSYSTVNLPEPAPPLMPQPRGFEVVLPYSTQDLDKFSGTANISDLSPR